MPKPSDPRREVLTGLLGLGSQSSRKSYYPELLARLEELEDERNRYKWLFENAVHGIFQASLTDGLRAANQPFTARGSVPREPRTAPCRAFGGLAASRWPAGEDRKQQPFDARLTT